MQIVYLLELYSPMSEQISFILETVLGIINTEKSVFSLCNPFRWLTSYLSEGFMVRFSPIFLRNRLVARILT